MSQHKFASITASLLARKGEARPWNALAEEPPPWRAEVAPPPPAKRRDEPPLTKRRDEPPPLVKDKSCSLHMSFHDYERLGIIAVKTGSTRQQLLKDALAQFLAARTRHFECLCLGPTPCAQKCDSRDSG